MSHKWNPKAKKRYDARIQAASTAPDTRQERADAHQKSVDHDAERGLTDDEARMANLDHNLNHA